MDASSLHAAYTGLKKGVAKTPYPTAALRRDRLRRLKQLLVENEQAFCDALSADFGYRSADQSRFADITTTIKSANHALDNLGFWMQPQRRVADLSLRLGGARCRVHYQPKGVIGIVSPWNFPVNLALSPLVSALAAGNTAYIKPSELAPRCAEVLAEGVRQHFSPDEVNVACGDADVARAFVSLPFDHLIYTGGERIAKSIMRDAADKLTPLTLELGGKSPVVVGRGSNLPRLAQRLMFGKFFNAGQVCIAPDYLMIQPEQLPVLLDALRQALAEMDRAAGADAVQVISDAHRARLKQLCDDAEQYGATLHRLKLDGSPYELTVVVDPGEDALIQREEIFGPVLLVNTHADFAEMLDELQHRDSPLVSYYFGSADQEFAQLRQHSRSGALVKNDVVFQYANDDLPFGGIGSSGMGRYRGIDGFREFSHARAEFHAPRIDLAAMVTPPFSSLFSTVNKMMRWL